MSVKLETTIQKYIGLSSDTKPTNVKIGSIFYAYDTGVWYKCYDGTNWVVYKISNQIFVKNLKNKANANDVVVATVTNAPVLIKAVAVHSNGNTTTDLTSIAIAGGVNKAITFISALEGAQANINAKDKQIAWANTNSSNVYLSTDSTIIATLTGTGETTVDLNVIIEYAPVFIGGYLT
mgnify:CR=1 FL=1